MNATLVRAAILFLLIRSASGDKPPARVGPTGREIKQTDSDVNEKLSQLHKTIDALQQTVKHMSDGHETRHKESSEKMKAKFRKLSALINKLSKQNGQLHLNNKRLRAEKITLVNKISNLEVELKRQAEEMTNIGAEAWLRNTASELKTFLAESGLEHFASPRFSPLIAGIVSNGVIILPLALTSMFLLNYAKQLTVFRIIMALNLFDLGFAIAILISSALLLGDPLEGMRHISEVNFVFIQLVVATVFWITCCFLVAAIVKNRKNRAWRYAAFELAIRVCVAVDYMRRVWMPVMERDALPIGVPAIGYVLYVIAAIIGAKLTSMANKYAVTEYRQVERSQEDAPIMVSIVSPRES